MNAFFRQVRAFPGGARPRDGGVAQLADQDFRGESQGKSEIFFEMRNGLSKVAYPVFVDGSEIERSGLVNVVNRREELAKMMVASPFMTRSIVNRNVVRTSWAMDLQHRSMTLGLTTFLPIQNYLSFLSEEFRRAEFDLRKLISWVALSKPYSLSSKRSSGNQSDDPLLGESPKFSHFYLRQMEAEQLYESMMVATEAIELQGSYEERERKKNHLARPI